MATSPLVPGLLPVAINGHAYQIDPAKYQRVTVPVIRQQADTSFEPGESSLNPQGLWRRSQESWVHGAGQGFLDGRKGLSAYSQISQDPERFRSSKGLDCWTQGQISLLKPTMKAWVSTNSNLHLAVTSIANQFILYLADGTEVYAHYLPFGLLNTLALQQGSGWTVTNATVSVVAEYFRLTATSAAAVTATSPTGTSGMAVDPGRSYMVNIRSFYVSGGAGRIPRVNVTWYTAAGATISTTTPVPAPGAEATSATAWTTVTAPANAAFVSMTLSYTANWANGEIHDIDLVNIGPTEDLPLATGPGQWHAANINAGQAAQTVQSLATDGYHLWAALGTSGLHRTQTSNTTSTADVPAAPGGGQISLVGYANGFLLAAGSATSASESNTLWLVNDPMGTAGGPNLVVIKTHLNAAFVWTGISPGRGCVYAYGNSGNNGEVYKILFDPNTGSLSTAASFATYLPDGETINTLQFYAGGIILGTGAGLRLGTTDGAGNIDYGPLIQTAQPVLCIEPQDRYVWFGLTRYDNTTSGLGRADLGFLVDNLTPAWATDLMMSDTVLGATGDVVSCVTFLPSGYGPVQHPPVRVFTVAQKGVYIEDPGSRVPSGQFQTGTIRYSTSEPKTTRSLDLRHHALPTGATITAEMQRDTSGTWEAVGSSSTTASYGPAAPLDLLSETAEALEFRFTLTRPSPTGTDYTKTPEMTRWTSKVLPVPSTIDETFDLAILMKEKVENNEGQPYSYPIGVAAEVAHLKALEQARTIVEFQVGNDTFTGYIEQTQFTGQYWGPRREYMEGEMLVRVQTVRG